MNRLFTARNVFLLIACLIYVAVPVYFVYSILNKPAIGTDDANILFVYARNFTQGKGIVYNAGSEHVEGFSCILYFLVCSIFYLFSNSPERIILAYNLVLAVVSCLLILRTIIKLSEKFNLARENILLLCCLFLVWIILNPLFFGWTVVSLMDSGTYGFLLVVAYCYFITLLINESISAKQNRVISLLLFLIIICRPEGLVWAILFLFNCYLLNYKQEKELLPALKQTALPIGAFITTILLLTFFRLAYFGYPLPNTYYSKVSSSFLGTFNDGLQYLSDFISLYSPLILIPTWLLLIYLAYLLLFSKEKTVVYYACIITLSFLFTGLIIPVLEGGDHFMGFRFFQNIYPLLIIPLILLLFGLNKANSFITILISTLAFIGTFIYFNNANWNNFYDCNKTTTAVKDIRVHIANDFIIAAKSREYGTRLNEIFKDELPVIGFGSAGGIAYSYKGVVDDMMGLNNTKMAHADAIKSGPKGHQSFNKKVFYELAPDILMPITQPSEGGTEFLSWLNNYFIDTTSWDNLIFKNLFNDPEFKQMYLLAVVANKTSPDYLCFGYFNKAYLQKLVESNKFAIKVF